MPTYRSVFQRNPPPAPDHQAFDTLSLYGLRRNLTGVPVTVPVRDRHPKASDHVAGAIHVRLLELGADYLDTYYSLGGQRIRVLSGGGQVLSAVKAQFRDEPPLPRPEQL